MKNYSKPAKSFGPRVDVYSIVTERIIALLEAGTVPWQKPWNSSTKDNNGRTVFPSNFISKRPYRGVNVFLLSLAPYSSPYWLTYNQARNLGGNVKKGEKGFPVVFWKRLSVEDKMAPGEKKVIPLLRHFTVFSVEQCEGIDYAAPVAAPLGEAKPPQFSPIEEAAKIVTNWKTNPVAIRHSGNRACYSPVLDTVTTPPPESFFSPEHYYATLFHELTHSTGHKDRLNRPGIAGEIRFGSDPYSKEELCAEMGSSFLCAHAGIVNSTVDASASYISHWLSVLKADHKLVVLAAAQAQKAADLILGIKFAEAKPEKEDDTREAEPEQVEQVA